jgi:hypothetical protein
VFSAVPLVLGFGLSLSAAEPALATDPAISGTSTDTASAAAHRMRHAVARPAVEHRPHWPAWIGAGGTILGLGFGTYYRAVAHEAAVEAQRTSDMDTYNRDLNQAHQARVLSTTLLIGAGVCLVGALVYYFWPGE